MVETQQELKHLYIKAYEYSPLKFIAMTKEKNMKQVNTKKEPTKTLKEKRAEKQAKRDAKK